MDLASKKTRTIERKLKNVESLPIGNEVEFYETSDYTTLNEFDTNDEHNLINK
ncbi:hypothetical protein D3C71_1757230 [compost metagenome]